MYHGENAFVSCHLMGSDLFACTDILFLLRYVIENGKLEDPIISSAYLGNFKVGKIYFILFHRQFVEK